VFSKPVPGRLVRDPQSRQRIPEAGIEVSDTDTFWARRVADGDVVVVVVKPPPPAPPPAPPAATAPTFVKTSSPKGKE
jgi:hypothetical protein